MTNRQRDARDARGRPGLHPSLAATGLAAHATTDITLPPEVASQAPLSADPLDRMRADVRAGFAHPQKELPPKYFYDTAGSLLFEEITRLPEYYLTRAEHEILDAWLPELARQLCPASVLELGAGGGDKSRTLIEAMRATGTDGVYVPLDISCEFIEDNATRLREAYPGLSVVPRVMDISETVEFPAFVPRPALVALLGSTIGNFDDADAVRLLRRTRVRMTSRDRLLLGADLQKEARVLERAYDDAQGVTARFNRNVLHVLNRELSADFDVSAFSHLARYDQTLRRIEMHLVATREQIVRIPRVGGYVFARGETIRTEISCKYDRAAIETMLRAAGFRLEAWRTDAAGRFALAFASPAPPVFSSRASWTPAADPALPAAPPSALP